MVHTRLKGLRNTELKNMKEVFIWCSIGNSFVHVILVICTAVVLLFEKHQPFSVIAALGLIFIPMNKSFHDLWTGFLYSFDLKSAVDRIKDTMILPTVMQNINRGINQEIAVSVNKVSCEWELAPKTFSQENANVTSVGVRFSGMKNKSLDLPVQKQATLILENISFIAQKGTIIGICGEPGSGKTALLMAVLGQLNPCTGHITRNGLCAYVRQKSWIWNASLRDNITFMDQFHQQRYYNAVYSCQLNDTMNSLPEGDETSIGSHILSQGVQDRVELARAIYSNRDIYVMDEPLTLIDGHSGKDIFEKVFLSALAGKTVIIATRHIMFLSRCDSLYVLKNGKIVGTGTHDELVNSNDEYIKLLRLYLYNNSSFDMSDHYGSISTLSSDVFTTSTPRTLSLNSVSAVDDDETAALTGAESNENITDITSPSYFYYCKKYSNYFILAFGLFLQIVYLTAFCSIPLLSIVKFEAVYFNSDSTFLIAGTALICFIIVTSLLCCCSFVKVIGDISKEISTYWMKCVCCASMSSLQTETTQSILRWFSINLLTIDMDLPQSLINITGDVISLLILITIMGCTFKWILLPTLLIAFLGIIIYKMYLSTIPNLQKLKTDSSTTLHKDVISAVNGKTTIQVYTKENNFISSFSKICDQDAAGLYLLKAAPRCVGFWMCILKVLFIVMILVMVALTEGRTEIFLQGEYQTASFITLLCVCISHLECVVGNLTESVTQYCACSQSSKMSSEFQCGVSKSIAAKPSRNPETEWSIIFQNVKLKYWPATYKKLSFKIKNSEKIGVIGYADAGRRSITAALFRLVDLSEGKIFIGGVNIIDMNLNSLRSNIGILPYDPVLFWGTILTNLTCNNGCNLNDAYAALKSVGLFEKVQGLPNGIETEVYAESNLFNTGEKQLLFLARALLCKPKILIIEEPLDMVSREIQNTIHQVIDTSFQSTTVIIIAQHLRYSEICDKLLIIKEGQVVEYGTPTHLLKNPRSVLSAMMFETEL